jgi:hypothetical protein
MIKRGILVIIISIIAGSVVLVSVSCCGLFSIKEEINTDYPVREETRRYKEREIEYFFETVFGAEYGDSDYAVHKWADDIRIDVKGHPTREDLEILDEVIFELNYLVDDINLSIVNRDSNIQMHFEAPSSFSSIEPNYIPGNAGFFWAWWDSTGNLYKARVLIATEGVTQDERSHLIWEELTQVLGIMNDSYEYADSIFYQEWTDAQGLSEIDKAVVSILYDPRIESGMTMEEVSDILY